MKHSDFNEYPLAEMLSITNLSQLAICDFPPLAQEAQLELNSRLGKAKPKKNNKKVRHGMV